MAATDGNGLSLRNLGCRDTEHDSTAEQRLANGLHLFIQTAVTGGLIGVLVGVGASSAVSAFGMPSSVPAWSIYVSFLLCVFIGVLFGYIPAQKAANMDPIEAIRHE